MSKKELNKLPLDQMERGDILLMGPYKNFWKYPIAALISWGTDSQWAHAAIYLGDGLILEANGSHGVHIDTLRYGKYANDYDWITLRVKPRQREYIPKAIKYAESMMWQGYDWVATYWIGFIYALKKLFGLPINKLLGKDNWADRDTRFFCFELVTDSFLQAGLNLAEGFYVDEANITAEHLLKSKYLYIVNKLEE